MEAVLSAASKDSAGGACCLLIGLAMIWLMPALLVAQYAAYKGRSGLGFFLLGILFSWILALIVALIISPDYVEVENRKKRGEQAIG